MNPRLREEKEMGVTGDMCELDLDQTGWALVALCNTLGQNGMAAFYGVYSTSFIAYS